MIKRMLLMLLAVTLLIGGLLGFKVVGAIKTKEFLSAMPEPLQTVSTQPVAMQDWTQTLEAVGSFRAVNGTDVSTEIPGIVDALSFESGAEVQKGDVLIHLRDADDVARLQALEASEKLAVLTLARDDKQRPAHAVSQAVLDTDRATLDSATASVAAQKAMLEKKTIRAPFTGRLGVRQVDIGQYVTAGAPLVTLQQLDPLYVDFTIPEQDLAHLSQGQKVTARTDVFPAENLDGVIAALTPRVEESTRTVQIRATFANPAHTLLPGMFARVTVALGGPQQRMTLPGTALTYNPYGTTLFKVEPKDGKPFAKQVFVTTGPTRGDQVTILSGVQAGDEIVTSGQMKLHTGTPLMIDNTLAPKNDADPHVEDR